MKNKTAKQMERHLKGLSNHHRIGILLFIADNDRATLDDIVGALGANVKTLGEHTRRLSIVGLINKVCPRPIPDAERQGIRRGNRANFVAVKSAPPILCPTRGFIPEAKPRGILRNCNKQYHGKFVEHTLSPYGKMFVSFLKSFQKN